MASGDTQPRLAQRRDDLSRIHLPHARGEHRRQPLLRHVVVVPMERVGDAETARTLVQLLERAIRDEVRVAAITTSKDRAIDEQGQSYFSVRTRSGAIPSSSRLRSASSTISGGPQR
jgi:hypothetical protein